MVFAERYWIKAFLLIFPILLAGNAFAFVYDDEIPDVTARVARISFLSGDAQVRRSGSKDWEVAVNNLPLVEGDEIATSNGGRVEIQFDLRTFVRLESNTIVRITTYRDEGIALSVPEGTASIRVTDFDRDKTFLEIDIPNATVAVQQAGLYRVDAGDKNAAEARVRVTEDGEARIYSDTSGFTLKSGRFATVIVSGNRQGEWNLGDASFFPDEFDRWTADRDVAMAKRIRDAFFDKYYDRDLYGAEDLNSYGEWVYTRKYGYVWRPFPSAIRSYADWSPYRYGHWRWIPPFGWTWVNDEPWGWSTYHYGRWVWDDGYWAWTPYGYYRYRRSWWQPALVVINIVNNNVCWYPLGYHHRYRNFNRSYGNGNWAGGGRNNNPGPRATPTPTNSGPTTAEIRESRRQQMHTPTLGRSAEIPPTGVVSVSLDDFGTSKRGIGRATLPVARAVLNKTDEDQNGPAILLPPIERVQPKISKEIVAETPPIFERERPVKIGAAERKNDQPLDQELKRTRILGDRTPIIVQPQNAPTVVSPEVKSAPVEATETRRTGAVNRPVMRPKVETPEAQTPGINPRPEIEEKPRYEAPRRESPKVDEPREQPRYEQPRQVETQKVERPQRIETPSRRESPPPPKNDSPRSEPKRPDPPPVQKSSPSLDQPVRKKDGFR